MVALQSKHVPPSEGRLLEGYTTKAEGCDAVHLDVTPRVAKIDQRPDHKTQCEKTHLAKQPGSWSECEGRPHLMHALDMCWQTKARWQQEFVCLNTTITNYSNFIPFPTYGLYALQNQSYIVSNFLKIDIKFCSYLDAFHIMFLNSNSNSGECTFMVTPLYINLILLGHNIFQFLLIERKFWQIVTCTCVQVLLTNLMKILNFRTLWTKLVYLYYLSFCLITWRR